jgi:hypothetical protein
MQPYGKVLSSAGNSLKEILTNINTMHGHIKIGYFSEVDSLSLSLCASCGCVHVVRVCVCVRARVLLLRRY